MTSEINIDLVEPSIPKRGPPAVLTIAGSDSSGGAGIEADLKTMTAHGVYGLTCITALTAQNTQGVEALLKIPKEFLSKILDTNFADFVEGYDGPGPLKVVKTGMLTGEATELLSERLDYLNTKNIKLVVDPVMVSTSGSKLVEEQTMALCLDQIIPNAYLCTPNFVEAEYLWKATGGDKVEVNSVDQFKDFVVQLQKRLKCANLLVKGGHIPWLNGKRYHEGYASQQGLEILDVLYQSKEDTLVTFSSPFIYSSNTHGTGCTLASSISSNLAKDISLTQAVTLSVHYIHKGMVSLQHKLGHGTGPLNHMVSVQTSLRDVVKGRNYHSEIQQQHGSLFQYFKNHEKVRENWENYTKHEFVRRLATNELPFPLFLYFLKQDFYYLVNYAQVHGLAASVAPNCEQIHAQSNIITNIMKEIDRHKLKLLQEYDVDYDHADLDDELAPARSCLAYCDYLLNIGKNEDFLGIRVALAPCLHGYAEAGVFGTSLRKKHDGALNSLELEKQSEAYSSWLGDYTSDWYTEANEEGEKTLDSIFSQNDVSDQRMEELVNIFNDVVLLEVGFWDEIIRNINESSQAKE